MNSIHAKIAIVLFIANPIQALAQEVFHGSTDKDFEKNTSETRFSLMHIGSPGKYSYFFDKLGIIMEARKNQEFSIDGLCVDLVINNLSDEVIQITDPSKYCHFRLIDSARKTVRIRQNPSLAFDTKMGRKGAPREELYAKSWLPIESSEKLKSELCVNQVMDETNYGGTSKTATNSNQGRFTKIIFNQLPADFYVVSVYCLFSVSMDKKGMHEERAQLQSDSSKIRFGNLRDSKGKQESKEREK